MLRQKRRPPQSALRNTALRGSSLTAPLAPLIEAKAATRLQAVGVHAIGDWQRLTRAQKNSFWGITAAMVASVDAAIRKALQS